jgi:hypothetical protein
MDKEFENDRLLNQLEALDPVSTHSEKAGERDAVRQRAWRLVQDLGEVGRRRWESLRRPRPNKSHPPRHDEQFGDRRQPSPPADN